MRAKLIASICAAALAATSLPAQNDSGEPATAKTKPAAAPEDRAKRPDAPALREFLRAHPRVFKSLKQAADEDGDGKLSEAEREKFLRMAHERMEQARKEQGQWQAERAGERQERRDERREDGKERREERREDRAERREERREDGKERREERREDGKERREERREDGKERREERREDGKERREERQQALPRREGNG